MEVRWLRSYHIGRWGNDPKEPDCGLQRDTEDSSTVKQEGRKGIWGGSVPLLAQHVWAIQPAGLPLHEKQLKTILWRSFFTQQTNS